MGRTTGNRVKIRKIELKKDRKKRKEEKMDRNILRCIERRKMEWKYDR